MTATNETVSSTGTARKTRLGILQSGRTPDSLIDHYPDYNRLFVELLGEDTFDYRHWPVLDNEFPEGIDDADAWLITGSRFGAYEKLDWIPPLESFIRDVYAAGRPLVGICFGHQIVAQALGGKVEKFSGGWSVGRVEYDLEDSVFGHPDAPVTGTPLMAFHQDQVIELPADARNVGSSQFCKHAALIYDNRILTIQPHPEFDRHFVGGLLQARSEILPADIKARAEQTLDLPVANDTVAQTLRRFLLREHR